MFGLFEKAQLKMHEVNLSRAIEMVNTSIKQQSELANGFTIALPELRKAMNMASDASLGEILLNTPLEYCDMLADIAMKSGDQYAKSADTLPYYYTFDILCGIFRSRVIEYKHPKLAGKTATYRQAALTLVEAINAEPKNEIGSDNNTAVDAQELEKYIENLGYEMTPFGFGVGVAAIMSGYSPAETASNLALLTFASDMREAGDDITKIIEFMPLSMAILECLKEWKDAGLIREELWQNDTIAFWKIASPSAETNKWIDRVLSDPVAGKERVAHCRISINP